jgi:hypothetical protein
VNLQSAPRPLEMPVPMIGTAGPKNGSYFNHRTQRLASELPREMIR